MPFTPGGSPATGAGVCPAAKTTVLEQAGSTAISQSHTPFVAPGSSASAPGNGSSDRETGPPYATRRRTRFVPGGTGKLLVVSASATVSSAGRSVRVLSQKSTVALRLVSE
jgi:hypothetical protein